MSRPKVVKIGAKDIPSVELVKGMHTTYNVCAETVGSEALRMGVCHHSPDMGDLKWEVKGEEAFYVARGSIRIRWEGEGPERGEVVLREGDQIFLPAGYQYTMQSTGEPAVNVFAIAGGPTTNVDKIIGPEATERLKSAAGSLKPR